MVAKIAESLHLDPQAQGREGILESFETSEPTLSDSPPPPVRPHFLIRPQKFH